MFEKPKNLPVTKLIKILGGHSGLILKNHFEAVYLETLKITFNVSFHRSINMYVCCL